MASSFRSAVSFVALLEMLSNFLVSASFRPYSPVAGVLVSARGNSVSTFVPLLSRKQMDWLPERAREVAEYHKNGLSLNHIQGCPLDCAYCIWHTYGLWDQRQPRALMSDTDAVEQLVTHRYFQPDITPVQIFNRATDPFLPMVKRHTVEVLEDLDRRGLHNHVLVITGHQVKQEDPLRLDQIKNLKLTLLFTYSGIVADRVLKRVIDNPKAIEGGAL